MEPDRRGEREFVKRPESKGRNKREEGAVDWKSGEREREREREREKERDT